MYTVTNLICYSFLSRNVVFTPQHFQTPQSLFYGIVTHYDELRHKIANFEDFTIHGWVPVDNLTIPCFPTWIAGLVFSPLG